MESSVGRVPEILRLNRLMEVTLVLEESHFMPSQLQKLAADLVDQPLGNGFIELASFSMVAPSSAAAEE